MSRVLRIGLLMFSAVALASRPAHAALPDWLEKLSGPGPFKEDALVNLVSDLVCFETITKISVTQTDEAMNPCVYADFHRFMNHDDDDFYKASGQEKKQLRVTAYAFGIGFQPYERLHTQVGVEVGRINFHTGNTDTGHWTLGARAQVKPLLFIRAFETNDDFRRWRRLASIWKVYVKRSVLLGTINGAKDFDAIGSGASYERKNEGVWSCGFLFDFSELLRPPR